MAKPNSTTTSGGTVFSVLKRLICHPKFRERNAPSLLVLLIFSLLLLSRLLDTALLGRQEEYLGMILLQILIFIIPGLLYSKWQGSDFRKALPLRMFRLSHLLLLLSAWMILVGGCLLISIHTGSILENTRGFTLYETFTAGSSDAADIILAQILTFAVIPAVCEELIFRGILLTSLQGRGTVAAFAFSSLYFAMLHFDFAQLPVYCFAGIVLCLVVRVTRSLPAAMLVHFLYNLFCLFGQSVLARFYSYGGNDAIFRFFLTVVLLGGVILFCGQAGTIYHRYALDSLPPPTWTEPTLRDLPAALTHTLFPFAGILCIILYGCVALLGT